MPSHLLKAAPATGGGLRESNPDVSAVQNVKGVSVATMRDVRERQTKAARNQSLFREINERIKALNDSFSLVIPVGEWVCECANDACVEPLILTADEYEGIRREPTRFFVAPADEHVWPDVERIIERRESYWVVEKVDLAATIATHHDPRANGR